MSVSAFPYGVVSAAGAGDSEIALAGGGVSASVSSPGSISTGWRFTSAGVIQYYPNTSWQFDSNWSNLAPTPSSGYEIRLTASGANIPSSGTANTWLPLTSTRTWLNSQSGSVKNILMTWTIEIRNGSGVIVASAVYTARSRIV